MFPNEGLIPQQTLTTGAMQIASSKTRGLNLAEHPALSGLEAQHP
jgi:hypothetical protein